MPQRDRALRVSRVHRVLGEFEREADVFLESCEAIRL